MPAGIACKGRRLLRTSQPDCGFGLSCSLTIIISSARGIGAYSNTPAGDRPDSLVKLVHIAIF